MRNGCKKYWSSLLVAALLLVTARFESRAAGQEDLPDIPLIPMVSQQEYDQEEHEREQCGRRLAAQEKRVAEAEREIAALRARNSELVDTATRLQQANADLESEKKRLTAKARDLGEELKSCGQPGQKTAVEPITGMKFVWVEGGCYSMGCGSWDSDCYGDEKPVHKVCVEGFWLGQYEVTQGQWVKIMKSNPAKYQKGDDYPVEQVSWDDAQKYIVELRRESGREFRLPSEAEWEYAARDRGKEIKYPWGNDEPVCRKGAANGAKFDDNAECDYTGTEPVGGYGANELGLYDMSGNVWEWCQDRWHGSYKGAPVDGSAWEDGTSSPRVNRGGGWLNLARYVRAANRRHNSPGIRDSDVGFRLAAPRSAFNSQ